ncbi:transposable element Tcb2 transposase [Trichonephila clavipes]|nr:transposable element Tcb2 transposase [Trichonephila clavipes]
MRVWKHWTDEHLTTRKTGCGQQKLTSASDERHLIHMANDHTASFRQLAAHWLAATGVLMPASSICRCLLHQRLGAKIPSLKILLKENHGRLRLHWAHEHRA